MPRAMAVRVQPIAVVVLALAVIEDVRMVERSLDVMPMHAAARLALAPGLPLKDELARGRNPCWNPSPAGTPIGETARRGGLLARAGLRRAPTREGSVSRPPRHDS
jgi:hypothetical protein